MTETNGADAVKAQLDMVPDLVKAWAVPTLCAATVMTDPGLPPFVAMARALKLTSESREAWAHLLRHLSETLKAAGTRATNAEGEPLWLRMPADGAWVATAIAPPEGAEGYRPLYVR